MTLKQLFDAVHNCMTEEAELTELEQLTLAEQLGNRGYKAYKVVVSFMFCSCRIDTETLTNLDGLQQRIRKELGEMEE